MLPLCKQHFSIVTMERQMEGVVWADAITTTQEERASKRPEASFLASLPAKHREYAEKSGVVCVYHAGVHAAHLLLGRALEHNNGYAAAAAMTKIGCMQAELNFMNAGPFPLYRRCVCVCFSCDNSVIFGPPVGSWRQSSCRNKIRLYADRKARSNAASAPRCIKFIFQIESEVFREAPSVDQVKLSANPCPSRLGIFCTAVVMAEHAWCTAGLLYSSILSGHACPSTAWLVPGSNSPMLVNWTGVV